jgi:hypothetical protein
VTYPQPEIASYISANFIPLKVILNLREDWPFFRAYNVLWTPTLAFLDRNGAMHYSSPGFLPPDDFLAMLRIGRARCLVAWTRFREAEAELETAAEAAGTFAPEALYWLGIVHYLERHATEGMWEAWDRLTARYPDSPWARRVYPRQSGPP